MRSRHPKLSEGLSLVLKINGGGVVLFCFLVIYEPFFCLGEAHCFGNLKHLWNSEKGYVCTGTGVYILLIENLSHGGHFSKPFR